MKRKRSLVFLLITVVLLTALALFVRYVPQREEPVRPLTPALTQAPVIQAGEEAPATEPPKVTDSPADGELPENAQLATDANRMAIAVKFVTRPVEELIEAVGSPLKVSYTPSADAAGEDGVLEYSGFTVNTYREGTEETVQSVQGS